VPEIAYLTNDAGEYSFTLPRGEFTLAFQADEYLPARIELDARTVPDAQLDMTLEPE
jgi:hypothetical protein